MGRPPPDVAPCGCELYYIPSWGYFTKNQGLDANAIVEKYGISAALARKIKSESCKLNKSKKRQS